MKQSRNLTAALAVLAATTALASAESLTVATDLPPTHFLSVQGVEPLMACITEASGGDITFQYFPSGQLVKRNEGIDAINKGLADITFATLALETANVPLQGVTMLPGMSTYATQGTVAWRKALGQDGPLEREAASVGVKPVLLNLLAPYQVMGKAPLPNVADWRGKKIRTTGSALNFLVESIGAVPVQMSANDLYTAMQRDTVDATVLSFASVKPYSVHEVATHMSSNASFGTSASWIGMSQSKFDSLSPANQAAIDGCTTKIEASLAAWIDENEGALREEFAASGITIYQLTDEQVAAFETAMEPVAADFIARLAERGLPAQAAYDEYKAVLAE